MSTGIRAFAPFFDRATRKAAMKSPRQLFGVAFTGGLSPALLRSLISNLPEGESELMCHPGRLDDGLRAESTRLLGERERELKALTDPTVLAKVRETGTELVNYAVLTTTE